MHQMSGNHDKNEASIDQEKQGHDFSIHSVCLAKRRERRENVVAKKDIASKRRACEGGTR